MTTREFYETKRCIVCQVRTRISLDKARLDRWTGGEHVQNVWPDKDADFRELLITGTHPACWDKMFEDADS